MFCTIWDSRHQSQAEQQKEQKNALTSINAKIGTLTDRLIETTSPSAIRAYETKLEAEKVLIAENLAKKPAAEQDYARSFRTALAFLAPPGIVTRKNRWQKAGISGNM